MHLFLTAVLPFLAHDHASAVAFLTCRSHNFHASIIPEFLSDEERVRNFYGARQRNQVEADKETQYEKLHNLVAQTPLMQFSPSLLLCQEDSAESILEPLLETKYFTRTLQRCSVFGDYVPLTNDLLEALSKVRSLTKLDVGLLKNEHLEIVVNSCPSLETLMIQSGFCLDPTKAISISSPPPPATKTLRSLKVKWIDSLLATQFIPNFPNLRKLELSAQNESQELDLGPLTSSLTFLTELDLKEFTLKNTESLQNLVHLSSLQFRECPMSDSLSFLTQEVSLPHLTTLSVRFCDWLSTSSSFASLAYASNLRVLKVVDSEFNNDCLQYLENMVHLRKLDLSRSKIVGDSRVFKSLMQNLFQLEELSLSQCRIGGQGAIAGALYSTSSRLRVLNLFSCNLVDDDLNGIGALKNTLEVLDLSYNTKLTNDGLVHCKDLMKLKKLELYSCDGIIEDLSPLKDFLSLEELDVSSCGGLTDDSFRVFSEDPNSFPNLRILNLEYCDKLSEKVFEYLSKNNHLMYQLKELNVGGIGEIVSASPTALNNICQLKGLRSLKGIIDWDSSEDDENKLKGEVMRSLKNLEEVD